MPTYVYKCKNCQDTFELFQNFSDKPKKKCSKCNKMQLCKVIQVPLAARVVKTASDWKTIGDLAAHNREKMSDEDIEKATPEWRKTWHEDKKIRNLDAKGKKDFIKTGKLPTSSDEHSLGMVSLTGKVKKDKKKSKKSKK